MTGGRSEAPQSRLSHLDDHGAARMVDVTAKTATARSATASGTVHTTVEVIGMITSGGLPKGDALPTARIAGVLAAKRTSELVPMCHQVALSGVDVDFRIGASQVDVSASVRTTDRTGVEMEALTAVTVAALTVYDMIKAVDPAARLDDIRVVRNEGGRNGVWTRQP